MCGSEQIGYEKDVPHVQIVGRKKERGKIKDKRIN